MTVFIREYTNVRGEGQVAEAFKQSKNEVEEFTSLLNYINRLMEESVKRACENADAFQVCVGRLREFASTCEVNLTEDDICSFVLRERPDFRIKCMNDDVADLKEFQRSLNETMEKVEEWAKSSSD